jgi:hypothetical protein
VNSLANAFLTNLWAEIPEEERPNGIQYLRALRDNDSDDYMVETY